MINIIFLTCEILAFLLVIYAFNDKQIKLNIKLVLLLFIDVICFSLTHCRAIHNKFQVIVYISILIYIVTEFKAGVGAQTLNIVLSIILVVFLQVVLSFFLHDIDIYWLKYFLINSLLLLCTFIITNRLNLYSLRMKIINYKLYIIILAVISVTLIIVSKINKHFSFLESLLATSIIVIVILSISIVLIAKKMVYVKQREIDLITSCNKSFETLLDDVRSKQHEFDNKINVLYSMQYVYSTYDELVSQQKKYASDILKDNKFNKLLTSNTLPVIKGYLYHQFQLYDKKGVEIEYVVYAPNISDIKLAYDIIDIIGILLSNAYDAMIHNNIAAPRVSVDIRENENNVFMEIMNVSPYICYKELNKFFKRGYSTKGDNRGLGLYNVDKLVKRYKGSIVVEQKEINDDTWLSFKIELKKELEPN